MKPAVYGSVNLETCVLNTSKLANKLTSFVNKYTKKQTNLYISVTKGTVVLAVVLAEVGSGDDPTDSDLDSESTDNESELTDVTMPSTASSTSSGITVIMRPRAQ